MSHGFSPYINPIICLQQADMKSFQVQNRELGAEKVMLTVFFTGTKLISLNALPSGGRFIRDYFISTVRPDIVHERRRILRRVRRGGFFVHIDNSMCHNGRK
jgi:hypothetical protein